MSIAEFAVELRAELDRAGLSVRTLAAQIAALPAHHRPSGMSPQSLSEFTSSGRRVRLPSDQQLRAVLLVCRTDRTLAARLRADRSVLAGFAPGVPGDERPSARPATPSGARVTPLAQHEVVVHLFAAADGPAVERCWAHLRATWQRCVDEFGLTSQIRAYAGKLPERCPAVGPGDAFLAARGRQGPGVVELAARRVHDLVCLSLVIAPEDGTRWAGLLASWQAVRGEPPPGLLGSVVIAQAVQAEPDALLDVARLAPQVVGELPLEGLLLRSGTLRESDPGGPYAVWEAVEESDDPAAVNHRRHRDLVVVAPAGRMPQLSTWTWSRGGTDRTLPPFARYLLHAAKLRYLARVRAESSFEVARAEVERIMNRRAGRLAAAANSLERSREKIRLLQLTGETAVGNVARNAAGDQRGGMFADDKNVGEWLQDTLATDLRYVQITLESAKRVLAEPPIDPVGPMTEGGEVDMQPDRRRALIAALESAYPTYADLKYMFDTELGRNLARDAREDGIRLVLNNVIGRAVAEGRLDELITAAVLGNPGNERLAALRTSGLAPLAPVLTTVRDGLEQVVDIAAGFRGVVQYATGLLRVAARVCMVEVVMEGRLVSAGTGFLVANDLVLTNHHVLAAVIDGAVAPTAVTCTFDYHVLADGVTARGSVHPTAADWLVASSPSLPGSLDYALVRVKGSPGSTTTAAGPPRGSISLLATAPTLVVGIPLLIVQHPERQPMQIAMNNHGVLGVDADGLRMTHAVNTLPGSSGSPCFTYDLELVALHHARAGGDEPKRNRAVPIVAIAADLRARGLDPLLGG